MHRPLNPEAPHDLGTTRRRPFASWMESIQDGALSSQPVRVLLLVLLASFLIGPLVALGLNWSTFTYVRPTTTADGPGASAPPPTGVPTSAALSAALLPTTRPATAVPTSAPATPAEVLAAPTSVPVVLSASTPTGTVTQPRSATSTPQPAATATPVPARPLTQDEVWAALQASLDRVWGVDAQATIVLLDDFLARYPDYQPARDMLYAVLVANASDLVIGGSGQAAADVLTRARDLVPDRPEARVALQALTPAPEAQAPAVAGLQIVPPAAPAQAARSQAPAPVPVPTRVAPRAVVVPAQPQPAPPTPTKIPFRPPAGP